MALFNRSETAVTFTNQTIIRVIVLVVVTLLGLNLLDKLTKPLILIFVALFLAVALNPAVSWITGHLKSKSRARATGFAYLAVLTILVSFFSLVIPPMVNETTRFISDLPETINSFEKSDTAAARLARKYNIDSELKDFSQNIGSRFGDFRGTVVSTISRVGSTIVSIITVLVLTFMMLVEGPYWLKELLELQPAEKREHRKKIAERMYRVVTGYVNGQLLIALIAAGFALVALLVSSTILNVSLNAVALAGIVALTGLIPLIGNTIGAAVVVLFCLFSSSVLAIIMAVFFLIYQQVENVTIQPYIQSRKNELTPLLVFLAAIIGVGLGGLFGALVAIPVAGCLKILVEDQFNKRVTT